MRATGRTNCHPSPHSGEIRLAIGCAGRGRGGVGLAIGRGRPAGSGVIQPLRAYRWWDRGYYQQRRCMEPARSTWHAFSFSSVTLDLSVLHTPAVKAIELPAGTLCQDLLGDGQLLHIGGAFIDPADFGVAIQLLHWIIQIG